VKRAITGLTAADTLDAQRAAVQQLQALTPSLLALKDLVVVAEAIDGLDRLLLTVSDQALLTAIGAAAETLADRATVTRMVGRLREPRVAPAEREALVAALGALAALSVEPVLHAYCGAAAVHAIAVGGDPAATTVLVRRVEQEDDEGVLAELLRAIGRLGAREALVVLARYAEPGGMLKRRSPTVRAAAVEGLAQLASSEARGLLELYTHD